MMGGLFFLFSPSVRQAGKKHCLDDEYSMEHEYEAQNVPGILRSLGCDRLHLSFIYNGADGIQS
jgi:hypothetical protein